jgi:hypothetical protein
MRPQRVSSSLGTPLVPGRPVPVFLFEALDELGKPRAAGDFEDYWGSMTEQGKDKYPLAWAGALATPPLQQGRYVS